MTSNSERAKKNPPKKLTFSHIQTENQFRSSFQGFQISKSPSNLLTVWERTPKSMETVVDVLSIFSKYISDTNLTYGPPNNEGGLYPFVQNLLKAAVMMNNYYTSIIEIPSNADREDLLEDAVETIAASQSRHASRRSSGDKNEKTGVMIDDACDESAGLILPLVVDTTDPQQLKNVYIAIEDQLRDENFNTGHVELSIVDKKGNPRILVEVKRSVMTDDKKGFYQLAAYMASAVSSTMPKIYGVYTDYYFWTFLCVDWETKIVTFSNLFTLFESNNTVLGVHAASIMRHLLEALDIPINIDVKSTLSAWDKRHAESSKTLMEKLKFTLDLIPSFSAEQIKIAMF